MATYDYETIGEYPRWGEDDPRSNELAEWLVEAQLVWQPQTLQELPATVSLDNQDLTCHF